MTAAKKPLYTSAYNEDGSISIFVDGADKCAYNFQEPLGKHLVAMEKYQITNPDNTEIETMAFLMSQLDTDKLHKDLWLGLPFKLFKFIATELNEFFRVEDIETV